MITAQVYRSEKVEEGNMVPFEDESQLAYARMLISRLERLSVDSYWAHRSSGLRGSLLRALERVEAARQTPPDADTYSRDLRELGELIKQGFNILENAAREIKGDEPDRRHAWK